MAKVMISLPDELLQRLDKEAERRNSTRSGLLQTAISHELGSPREDTFKAALARGRAALEPSGSFESADLVRELRDSR